MAGHIVFVRFFLGFTESFQFDRIVRLKDTDICGVLDTLCEEWWSEPANREPYPELQTGPPPFRDIAARADWYLPLGFEGGPLDLAWGESAFGITHRFPVMRFKSRDLAEVAVEALQKIVVELARAAAASKRWDDAVIDRLWATPRFIGVNEEELTAAELVTERVKIQILNGPPRKQQILEEGLLRHYWSDIYRTLQMIERDGNKPDPKDGFVSAKDLAKEIDRSESAVKTFLTRFAKNNKDCRIETPNRRHKEPTYLYRRVDVLPALREHFGL